MDHRPIGIFDSGVGGLTVVKEIIRKLPKEDIVYLGDTARVPYGTKSPETIKLFSIQNVKFLMQFDVKLIVVACNTAGSISLPTLKKRFRIPIIGVIEAGAKKALSVTKSQKIGVIGTYATIRSKAYEKELKGLSKDVQIISQACPLFVPLAEEGWLDGKIAVDIAKIYLEPLCKKGIDTIVLGCTHYPLLKSVISNVVGREVSIVDSASSVADEVRDILEDKGKLKIVDRKPAYKFFATDAVEQFIKVGERFLGTRISKAKKVRLG